MRFWQTFIAAAFLALGGFSAPAAKPIMVRQFVEPDFAPGAHDLTLPLRLYTLRRQ